jgi:hypothetical protein
MYKILVICPKLKTAKKVYELLENSEVYKSEEIMILNPIKEVCDECSRK